MKITLSNKEFNLDNLNNEQETKLAEFLSAMQTEDDPFDIGEGEEYFYQDTLGNIQGRVNFKNIADVQLHRIGNICKDENLLRQLESRAVLTRLMWIYSIRHGGRKLLNKEAWKNSDNGKYFCAFNHAIDGWTINWATIHNENTAYFIDEQTAKDCIKEVIEPYCAAHPELGYN